VVASDIYVLLTGENLSRSIRRNLVSVLAQSEATSEASLAGADRLLADHFETIQALTTALSKNDAKTAREEILKLPAELRNDRAIQVLTLNTYKASSAFATVLAGIRRASPEDVFMDMVAIDIFARQKKYPASIEAIERVYSRVGQDPYLKILHGRMLLRQSEMVADRETLRNENREAGRRMIREAISEDDGLLSGYWNLVSFSLADQDHGETLRLLKLIHNRFKIRFKDLREIPSYKQFVTTSEFRKWTEYLASQSNTSEESAPGEDLSARENRPQLSQPETNRRTASRTGRENQ